MGLTGIDPQVCSLIWCRQS